MYYTFLTVFFINLQFMNFIDVFLDICTLDILNIGGPQITRFQSAQSPGNHGFFWNERARIPWFNMFFIRKSHLLSLKTQIKQPILSACDT